MANVISVKRWLLIIILLVSLGVGQAACDGPTPVGPNVPPHVISVSPPNGAVIGGEEAGIYVELDLQAGVGVPPTPSPDLFVDGVRVDSAKWILRGDPPSEGILKHRTPVAPTKHVFEIRYQDKLGQTFTYTWRAVYLGAAPPPLDQLPPAVQKYMPQVPPEILATVEVPILMSPTPLPCTSLPEGVVLRVEPLSPAEAQALAEARDELKDRPRSPLAPPPPPTRPPAGVRVEIEGLQPGERPRLIFHAKSGGLHHYEVQPAQPAGSDGRLVVRENRVRPLGGQETTWEIKVVHARGVACTDVTLP